MVRISVVIPTYNNAHVLRTTLARLSRQDYPPEAYEVVVVDDGSTDETAEVVRAQSSRLQVRYIWQPNAGRSAARNRGAREARHEVLLFMDSDIWAEPNVLGCHARHHAGGERVGVQGPTLVHPESRVNTYMQTKRLLPDLTIRRRANMSPYHVITQNFSVRREDFWAIGGFDERFRGYGLEDIELGYRLHQAGVRLLWEPQAKVWHYHVEDLPTALRKQVENGTNAVYFWRKHGRRIGMGLFLEILPVLLPWKWLVYRSGLLSPVIRSLLRLAERAAERWTRCRMFPLLVCDACYHFLLFAAYYEGVFRALRAAPPGWESSTAPEHGET